MTQITLESLEEVLCFQHEVLKLQDVAFVPAGTDDPIGGRVVAILRGPSEGLSWYQPTVVLACEAREGLRYLTYPANKVERGRND